MTLFRRGITVGLSETRRVHGATKRPPARTLLECLQHREADVPGCSPTPLSADQHPGRTRPATCQNPSSPGASAAARIRGQGCGLRSAGVSAAGAASGTVPWLFSCCRAGRGWDDRLQAARDAGPYGMRARPKPWRRGLYLRVASCCLSGITLTIRGFDGASLRNRTVDVLLYRAARLRLAVSHSVWLLQVRVNSLSG